MLSTELLRRKEKVQEIDLVALPTDQLLQKLMRCRPVDRRSLYQPSPQESVQPAMGIYDILSAVGRRFRTYCIFPIHCVNHGGIGGVSTDMETQARFAAEISRRVLLGERPEDIPVMHDSGSRGPWTGANSRDGTPESACRPIVLSFSANHHFGNAIEESSFLQS